MTDTAQLVIAVLGSARPHMEAAPFGARGTLRTSPDVCHRLALQT